MARQEVCIASSHQVEEPGPATGESYVVLDHPKVGDARVVEIEIEHRKVAVPGKHLRTEGRKSHIGKSPTVVCLGFHLELCGRRNTAGDIQQPADGNAWAAGGT